MYERITVEEAGAAADRLLEDAERRLEEALAGLDAR
jgi:hypothetical protein